MKKSSGFFEGLGYLVAGLAALVGVLFLSMLGLPLAVFFGWLAGHILCLFAGSFIVTAITALLGAFGITATITTSMIPLFTAALAFFGYFFKSTQTNNNN